MAGSMRKMAVYLGLVEDDRYDDDYDDDGYGGRRDSYDRPVERSGALGAQRSLDQHLDRSMDRPLDRPLERSLDRPLDRSVDRHVDRHDDRHRERSVSPLRGEDLDRGRPMAAVREEALAGVTPMSNGLAERRGSGSTALVSPAAGPAGSGGPAVAVAPPPASDLSQITTIHPRTYNEAKAIGERFRGGTPVIMNLTEMDDRDAKRLVDFAAGLVFGLHGTIERVTSKVFLLSPANVTVTAEDKARMAEGFYNQS